MTRNQWTFVALTAASFFVVKPAFSAPILYRVAPSFTTLEFTVENMYGAFQTTGKFLRFSGDLLLDLDVPENSHVDVTAEAASIHTEWDTANQMLMSADYLDSTEFPSVQYTSDRVDVLGPDHVVLHGQLTIRGVTRPLDLDARLEKRHDEPGLGPVADFDVKGEFARADYGMTTDYPLVAKEVSLRIRSHILLTPVDTNAQ